MAEQEQNRSEQATPFKLQEARNQGQVAKSLEFNTMVAVAALIAALAFWGGGYWARLCELCAQLFGNSSQVQFSVSSTQAVMGELASLSLALVLPFMVTGVLAAIISNVVQTGFIFSAEPLKPRFERLDPVAGFKRLFNVRMLFEAVKALLKLMFFTAIAYAFFVSMFPQLLSLGSADVRGQAEWLGSSALSLLFRLGLAFVVVGVIDFAFSRWRYAKQMMMSRREVKEEVKRREGDPQIRAKIRELQRENLKQARSMGRLPDADVLITNPTHLAVALSYDRQTMSAPVVIAKGTDHWAAQMKTMARRHGVPILERRSLARLLFSRGILDQPIPAESFMGVARVYAELGPGARDTARARYEVSR